MKRTGCFIIVVLYISQQTEARVVKLGFDHSPSVLLRDSVQAGQLQSHKLDKAPADLTLNPKDDFNRSKCIFTHL